jgi:hypothetical protein
MAIRERLEPLVTNLATEIIQWYRPEYRPEGTCENHPKQREAAFRRHEPGKWHNDL